MFTNITAASPAQFIVSMACNAPNLAVEVYSFYLGRGRGLIMADFVAKTIIWVTLNDVGNLSLSDAFKDQLKAHIEDYDPDNQFIVAIVDDTRSGMIIVDEAMGFIAPKAAYEEATESDQWI